MTCSHIGQHCSDVRECLPAAQQDPKGKRQTEAALGVDEETNDFVQVCVVTVSFSETTVVSFHSGAIIQFYMQVTENTAHSEENFSVQHSSTPQGRHSCQWKPDPPQTFFSFLVTIKLAGQMTVNAFCLFDENIFLNNWFDSCKKYPRLRVEWVADKFLNWKHSQGR